MTLTAQKIEHLAQIITWTLLFAVGFGSGLLAVNQGDAAVANMAQEQQLGDFIGRVAGRKKGENTFTSQN